MLTAEWWAFEVVALAAGLLGDKVLAAQTIMVIVLTDHSSILVQCYTVFLLDYLLRRPHALEILWVPIYPIRVEILLLALLL